MSRTDTIVRFTRGSTGIEAGDLAAGGGVVLADGDPETTAFELFDTFDAQVAAAGRLLLRTETGLVLIGGGSVPEQPVSTPGFVEKMKAGAVTEALGGMVSPLRALMPMASGTADRQRLRVVDEHEKTELRCEIWTLRAGNRATVGVTALKALRGYEKTLERIRRTLDAHAAGHEASLLGSAAEAAAMLRGEEPGGAPRFDLRPDQSAFAAACGIIAEQLAAMRLNEPGIRADIDSEFLHDYRVALRRVRSVVSLFRGAFSETDTVRLKARFGVLMARTGRLRDLDVYLLERGRYQALVPETRRAGIGLLFDRFAEERQAEQQKVATWIEGKAYVQEIGRLVRLFDQPKRIGRGPEADHPALDYARGLIWKRYRTVCKRAAVIAGAPDEEVHELRIHCKKLRYLMEFFAPLFAGAELRPLIKALKRVQDNLGAFNDYSVQQASLETAARDVAAGDSAETVEIAAGIGALVTVLHQRQEEERDRIAASFAAFDSAETRAAFRALFKPERETV